MPPVGPERVVVFAGPSLPGGRADAVLAAAYRPPARRGDFYRVLPERPRAIVLLDGEFHGAPAVWHREILDAMAEGVPVIGAASMGALRAAEMHDLGMIGCGRIFAAYRDGALDDDDEVAQEYGPIELGYPPLSEPLVNIRATLEAAVGRGVLGDAQARSALAHAKRLHYPHRSFAATLRAPALGTDPAATQRLAAFFATSAIDQKRADALAALRLAGSLPAAPPAPPSRRRCPGSLVRGLWAEARASVEYGLESGRLPSAVQILERAGLEPAARDAFWAELSWRWFARAWLEGTAAAEGRAPPCPAERAESGDQPGAGQLLANRLSRAAWLKLTAETAAARAALDLAASALEDAARQVWLERTLAGEVPPAPFAASGPSARTRAALDACARRAVVTAWAGRRGVAVAPHDLAGFVRRWEAAAAVPRPLLLQRLELAEGEYLAVAAERALAAWVVDRGPAYFGFAWSFEVALTRELQRLGRAGRLFARGEA